MRRPAPLCTMLLLTACGVGEVRPPATSTAGTAAPAPSSTEAGRADGTSAVAPSSAEPTVPVALAGSAAAPSAPSPALPPGWALPATRPGPFPGAELATVRAYAMEPLDASGRPHCLEVLDPTGALCSGVRGPGVVLSASQVTRLLAILRAPASYGGGSKCFIPRHGFVFHDAAGVPIAEVAVCFECEMIRGQPTLRAGEQHSHGVSDRGLADLRALCEELGMTRCE